MRKKVEFPPVEPRQVQEAARVRGQEGSITEGHREEGGQREGAERAGRNAERGSLQGDQKQVQRENSRAVKLAREEVRDVPVVLEGELLEVSHVVEIVEAVHVVRVEGVGEVILVEGVLEKVLEEVEEGAFEEGILVERSEAMFCAEVRWMDGTLEVGALEVIPVEVLLAGVPQVKILVKGWGCPGEAGDLAYGDLAEVNEEEGLEGHSEVGELDVHGEWQGGSGGKQ